MIATPFVDRSTRARLSDAVAKLAIAIDTGDCRPRLRELWILARLCDEQQLPIEAARVRRWIGDLL